MATELAQLAGRLELDVLSDGRPANPVVVLPLDRWRDAPPANRRVDAGEMPFLDRVAADPAGDFTDAGPEWLR